MKSLFKYIWVLMIFFITSCVTTPPSQDHKHNFTNNVKFNSEEHWGECECGESEIPDEHDFIEWFAVEKNESQIKYERSCKYCDFKEYKVDDVEHNYVTTTKNPTCSEAGFILISCDECGFILENNIIDPLGHDIVLSDAVEATCTNSGLTKGEYCTRCDYKVEQEEISPLGHEIIINNRIEPTCTTTGLTEGEYCIRCDYNVEQEEIAPLGHNIVINNMVEPTCTTTGLTEGEYCTRCSYIIEQEKISELGHDIIIDEAIEASCKNPGLTEGEHCSRCNYKIEQKVIEQGEHKYKDGICEYCNHIDDTFIKIYTVDDFDNVRKNLTGNYILMNDIEFTSDDYKVSGKFYNNGNYWIPIGSVIDSNSTKYSEFSGIFNGNGYSIKNVKMYRTPTYGNYFDENCELSYYKSQFGLFALNLGVIRNLTVTLDYNLVAEPDLICGGICSTNGGLVENCSTYGSINFQKSNTGGDSYIGGIVGNLFGGIVTGCANYINISGNNSHNFPYVNCGGIVGGTEGAKSNEISYCFNAGNIQPTTASYGYLGGIIARTCIGNIYDGFILNLNDCFNMGNIGTETTPGKVSGISAEDYCNIERCYNIGMILSLSETSGILNSPYGNGLQNLTNCYYLDTSASCSILNYNTMEMIKENSLNYEQIKLAESFVGFDFENIWTIDSLSGYPYPQLQNNKVDTSIHTKHVFTEIHLEEPTCTTEGNKQFICYCGYEYKMTLQKLDHQFDIQNSIEDYLKEAANCEHGDIYYYSCACGEKSSETYTMGNAYHNSTRISYNDDETLTDCGSYSVYCNLCYRFLEKVIIEGNGGTPTLIYEDVDELTCKIIGINDGYSKRKIVIPEYYNGKKVVSIDAQALKDCRYINTFVVSETDEYFKVINNILYSKDGKTLIKYANGSSATSVTIPNGIESIEDYAFAYAKFETLIIPDSVNTIGYAALKGCDKIKKLSTPFIGNKINEEKNSNLKYMFGLETDGYYTSSLPYTFVELNITKTETIFEDSLSGCGYLKKISLPNNLKKIESNAFNSCSNLVSIRIPSSVLIIGDEIFNYCTKLTIYCVTSVKPEGWSETWHSDRQVYWSCDNTLEYYYNGICFVLDLITKQATINKFDYYYDYELPTSINVSGEDYAVTAIANYAFSDTYHEKVIIPESITSIGKHAFENTGVKDIVINANILEIPSYAFYNSYSINSIEIRSNTITEIGEYSFSNCNSLTNIVLPEGLKTIKSWAFTSCSIKNITLPKSLEAIHAYAFENSAIEYIEIPLNTTYIGEYAFSSCSSLKEVKINSKIKELKDGVFAQLNLQTINIPNSVETIGSLCFSNNSNLISIELPESLKRIEEDAFSYCGSLEQINIPKNVEYIAYNSFNYCSNLKYITVDSENDYFTSINGNLYSKDETILYKYASGREDTHYIMPNSVVEIKPYALSGSYEQSNLTDIVLSTNLKIIGDGAFSSCINLRNIEIPNSVIKIGSYLFNGCDNLQYYIEGDTKYIGNKDNPYLILVEMNNSNVTNYEVNSNVKFIGSNAFSVGYSSKLTTVIIPSSIISIGSYAFSLCRKLTNIVIPSNVEYMGYGAFYDCTNLGVINCEADNKPEAWDSSWNYFRNWENHLVCWGYKA